MPWCPARASRLHNMTLQVVMPPQVPAGPRASEATREKTADTADSAASRAQGPDSHGTSSFQNDSEVQEVRTTTDGNSVSHAEALSIFVRSRAGLRQSES